MKLQTRFSLPVRMAVLCSLLAVACLALYWKSTRPKNPVLLSDAAPAPITPPPPEQEAGKPAVQRPDASIDATPPNVNLLKAHPLEKSVIQGGVYIENDSIISTSKSCWIQVPMTLAPRSQYELAICVTRTNGNGHFFLALPIGDKFGVIAIDKTYSESESALSGIEYLAEKEMADPLFYPLAHRGELLPKDKPVQIAVRVEADEVVVSANDQTVYVYRGDLSAISLPPQYRSKLIWKSANICFGGDNLKFRVDKLEYRPLTTAESPRLAASDPAAADAGRKSAMPLQAKTTPKPVVESVPEPAIDVADAVIKLKGEVVQALVAGQRLVVRVRPSAAASAGGDGQLQVIDVADARLVRRIDLLPGESLFAAGLDTLVTLNPESGDARRFDLSTGELKWADALENDGCRVLALLLGSHASGPLWMVREGQDLKQFDPQTFWPISLSRKDGKVATILSGSPYMRLRVSGDGQTVGVWQPQITQAGFELLVNSEGRIGVAHDIHSYGPVMPDVDGAVLLTQQLVLNKAREAIETAPFESVKDFAFMPAVTGPFYLRVLRVCPLGTRSYKEVQDPSRQPATDVGVFVHGCPAPVHEFRGLPVFPVANRVKVAPEDNIEVMPNDRLFLMPELATLAVIPVPGGNENKQAGPAEDEVRLYRFDLDAGLRAAAVNRPLVYSQPIQLRVLPGGKFSYTLRTFNPGGNPIRFQVVAGPDGMTIDNEGRLSWQVAKDARPGRFPVAVSVTSGAVAVRHEFVLEVPAPESDIPRRRVMASVADANAGNDAPPEPLAEPLIVDLPFSFSEAHCSGDYLVLRVSNANRLAQFDLRRRVLTRFWDLGDRKVACAAGGGKLVMLYADQMQIERWDLASQKCELSRQLPGTDAPNRLRMGTTSNGPIWAATENELYPIDLDTLQPIRSKLRESLSRFDLCVSGNGRIAASWQIGSSPSGFSTRRLVANEIEHFYASESPGQIFPNQDGSAYFVTNMQGVYDNQFQKLDRPPYARLKEFLLIPSTAGPFCFGIPRHLLQAVGLPVSQHYEVPVFVEGSPEPIGSFKDTNVQPINQRLRPSLIHEEILIASRIVYRPSDQQVVFLAASNDQIRFYPFDAGKALNAARPGVIVIYSFPRSNRVAPGETLRYQIRAYAPKGSLAYFLADAPEAMSVSNTGVVEWNVPAGEPDRDVPVTIMVRSETGAVAYQNLTFFVRTPVGMKLAAASEGGASGRKADAEPGEPPLAQESSGKWQVVPDPPKAWPPEWTCVKDLRIPLERYELGSFLFPRGVSPFVAVRNPKREPNAEGRLPAVPASSFTLYQVFDIRSGLSAGARFVEQGMYGKMSIHDLSPDGRLYLAVEYKSNQNDLGRPPLSKDPGAAGVLEIRLLPTNVDMPGRPMVDPKTEQQQPKTDKRPAWVPEDTGTLLDTIDVFDYGKVEHARYALAGRRRAMVFCEGVYRLYDIASRKKILEKKTDLVSTFLSPGGTYLAYTSTSSEEVGTVEIYDVRNLVRAGMLRARLGDREVVQDATFAPDGTRLCCTTRDANGNQTFRIYDLATQALIAEQKLPESKLGEISRMLRWHQSPAYASASNERQFTVDSKRLIISGQVVMNLDDGEISTPLIPGRGLPPDTRAVYTGWLRPMPDGSLLAVVHDGQAMSLRSIGRTEEPRDVGGSVGGRVAQAAKGVDYAVDIALPPLRVLSREAAKRYEVPAAATGAWQVVLGSAAAPSPPLSGPPLHGTAPLFEPDRMTIHDALFPSPAADGTTKPVMALTMAPDAPIDLDQNVVLQIARFDFGSAPGQGKPWPVPLDRLELPFATEPVSLSSEGRFVLCRLRAGMNRLDIFDLDTQKHALGFRPYADLGEDHDRLEGYSKTLVVEADWIGDRHILTMNRTGLLVLWDLSAKQALYETRVMEAQAINGTPLGRHTPLDQGANAGLPNKAAAICPSQLAGSAFRISPRREIVMVRAKDELVAVDLRTGKPLGTLAAAISAAELGYPTSAGAEPSAPLRVTEIAFCPDGSQLAALVSDATGDSFGPRSCTRQAVVAWDLRTGTLRNEAMALTNDLEARLLGWTDSTHCLVQVRLEQHGLQGLGRQDVKKYQLLDMVQVRPIWRYEAAPAHEDDPTAVVTLLPDGRAWTAPLHTGNRLQPVFTIQRLPDQAAARFLADHRGAFDGPPGGNPLKAGDSVAVDFEFNGFPDFIDVGRERDEINAALLATFSNSGIVVNRDSKNRLKLVFKYLATGSDAVVKLADHLPQYGKNPKALNQVRAVLRDTAIPCSTMECTVALVHGATPPMTLDVLTATTLNEVIGTLTGRIEPMNRQTMQKLEQQQFDAIAAELKSASIGSLSGERTFAAGLGTSVFDKDGCHVVEAGRRSVNGIATAAAETAAAGAKE